MKTILATALILIATTAHAQDVHWCGNTLTNLSCVNGNVVVHKQPSSIRLCGTTFTNLPCKNGIVVDDKSPVIHIVPSGQRFTDGQ